jgi:hypothetical protein
MGWRLAHTSGSIDLTVVIEFIYVFGILLTASIGVYAAYWSFAIRRALRVKSYSRQALTIGLVTLYGVVIVSLFYYVDYFAPSQASTAVGELQSSLYILLPPILLAWADSSIKVGHRSDPLLRDPLWWSKSRWAAWALMVGFIIATVAGFEVSTDFGIAMFILAFAVLGVSIVPVLLAARRSGDKNYRKSLEWFGAFLAVLLAVNVGFLTIGPDSFAYSLQNLLWALLANIVLDPLVFYCMYKCSKSLLPLNKLALSASD